MNNLHPPEVHCPKCKRYIGAFYGKAQCRTCGCWHVEPWPEGALWVDSVKAPALCSA